MSFQDKYLKYKKKYDLLKKQMGSAPFGKTSESLITLKENISHKHSKGFNSLNNFFIVKNNLLWNQNANDCKNDKYGLKDPNAKNKRIEILITHLFAFCNDEILDLVKPEEEKFLINILKVTQDKTSEDVILKYYTRINLKNIILNDKVKMLFNAINTNIDENAKKETKTEIKFTDGYHFVVGSSQMNNPTNQPASVADALVNILYENKKDNIITFGTKESKSPNHFKWNLIKDEPIIFNINNEIINENGLTIYFTFGSHTPAENIISINNFEKSFKQLIQLRDNNKLRLIVTGTDAVNPSTETTCYKVNLLSIGYSFSKLYQLVKCAWLVSQTPKMKKHLDALDDELTRVSNIPSNVFNNETGDLRLQKYNTLATEILLDLDNTPNFGWAKNLSVMLTNMHVSRFIDYSNINVPINQELIPAVLNGSMTNIEAIKNKITSDILFRGRNMITIKQAALEHIYALNRITQKV